MEVLAEVDSKIRITMPAAGPIVAADDEDDIVLAEFRSKLFSAYEAMAPTPKFILVDNDV